ncbi:MAG: FAD-dependent oxidoreductase [Cyanobacteriota bacterium]|nr:FAD-dependent oxidoreductase [Cyanobacteriota bacterium]
MGARPSALTRREFLLGSLATGAALMLAERRRPASARSAMPRVVIIGAGFGGLSCAYQLRRAGVQVTVLEARPRLGGRVHSLDTLLPEQKVEAGAELIGLNHPTWLAYAKQFGLPLNELPESDEAKSPIILNGRRLLGEEVATLWTGLDKVLQSMNGDARTINRQQPWLSANAKALDNQSLREAAQRWPGTPLERDAAMAMIANDMNCLPERYSYLAMLASIAGGGVEAFWSESEIYRCGSGNQSLAFALARAIGEANIQLRAPVAAIDLTGRSARVTLASGAVLEADAVVLTAPPSTWDELRVTPAIPTDYRMGTGTAIKVLNRVDHPFWKADKLEPDSLSDQAVGMTWQGGEPAATSHKAPACLTVFAGGQAAQAWLDRTPAQRRELANQELTALFPGFTTHNQQQVFLGWPSERWTRCGYSAPSLGQVTRVLPLLQGSWRDKLFFAGEYTSPGFYGYMEGGLQSGAVLAGRLARQFNLVEAAR